MFVSYVIPCETHITSFLGHKIIGPTSSIGESQKETKRKGSLGGHD